MDPAGAPSPPTGARSRLDRVRSVAAGLGCSPPELAALAVLVAGALAALGVLWASARPPDGGVSAAGVEAGSDRSGLEIELEDLVVHVAGHIAKPGVYRLPGGSRVGDAVAAAGGPLPGAVTDGLNFARPLADGEQLMVPGPQPASSAGAPAPLPGAQTSATRPDGTLDLNLATAAELEELPGIGPVLAERIVRHRESIGRFQSTGDLRAVTGIGERTFQQLAPLVSV